MKKVVLVAVINRKKDLEIALNRHWYRMPKKYAPKKKADFLALYQTRIFNSGGKSINFYTPIKKYSLVYRRNLLPSEKHHPRRDQLYQKLHLGPIKPVPISIKNKTSLRINFGFTTLEKLFMAREIGQLFDIGPLEKIMSKELKRNNINAIRQYCIMKNSRCRYRLDFAVFCKNGKINIECDNEKWHFQSKRRKIDRRRNQWLLARGWKVLRFSNNEIINSLSTCMKEIKDTIHLLGGVYPI